jgi:uncharacterized membrane protein
VILNRNGGLFTGLFAAALNVAVIVFGFHLTPEALGALNAFALALVALIANADDPTTAGVLGPRIVTPPTAPNPPAGA